MNCYFTIFFVVTSRKVSFFYLFGKEENDKFSQGE